MNMTKQYRKELRRLYTQRDSARKLADKQLLQLRRQFKKDLDRINRQDDRRITRINRRIAILEGRLS